MNFALSSIVCAFLIFHYSIAQYSEKTWQDASAYLRETMNESYPPCDNFYKYVCKGFEKRDDNDSASTQFEYQQQLIVAKLGEAIKEIKPKGVLSSLKQLFTNAPDFESRLRELYDSCIKSQRSGFPSQILRRLYNSVGERIGYLPIFGGHADKPWRVMGTITREMGMELLITSYVWQPQGSTTSVLGIDPVTASTNGEFNATEATSLLHALSKVTGKSASDKKINELVEKMSAFYEDWKNVSESEHDVYMLQTSLANLTSRAKTDKWKSFFRNLLAGHFGRSGSVDWQAYLSGLLQDSVVKNWTKNPSQAMISTNDYSLINEYGNLFKRHSEDTIFSYAFLDSLKSELNARDPSAELAVSAGSEDRCVQFAYNNAPAASARVLLKKLGVDAGELRNDIALISTQILAAFIYVIGGADWMEADDKGSIITRLESIRIFPALPAWITDDNVVAQRTPKFDKSKSLYENDFDFRKKLLERYYQQVVNGISYEDIEPDFSSNAEFEGNLINIHLGQVLPPQFKTSYPLPVKYGGLGFIIAHQLFHAFDPSPAREELGTNDEPSYVLQPETQEEYNRRRSCLIQQYSKYCDTTVETCVPGDTTVDDNIGDVEGLKVAYAAYKFVSEVAGGEPPVPGFVDRTGDQVFFITFARLMCAKKGKQQFLQSAASTIVPSKVRVDLSIANFPQFAGAFRCPVGSTFAPLKRCSLWGGYNAPIQQQDKKRRR